MDDQQGLAGAMQQAPDLSAPPPQTPEELEQRKSAWAGVLQHVQSDPNIMRAIGFMGVRMLQPGATFGQGVAAGYGAYQTGLSAQQDQERQAQLDAQKAQVEQAQIAQMGAQTAESTQRTELAGKQAPLTFAKLQAEVDAIPDETRRKNAQTALDEWTVKRGQAMLPYDQANVEAQAGAHRATAASTGAGARNAEIAANREQSLFTAYMTKVGGEHKDWNDSQIMAEANRQMLQDKLRASGGGAGQLSDEMFNAFLAEEQAKNPLPAGGNAATHAAIQRANAFRALNESRYGTSQGMKAESADQQAVDYYNAYPTPTPSQEIMMSDQDKRLWARGKALVQKGGKPANDTGVQQIGTPQAIPVINAVRKDGKIVRGQ